TLSPPRNECCVPAPPVMEFDPEGNLVQAWGGPGAGYDWPENEHGVFVDAQSNVWLAGNAEKDAQILKFTRDGRFQMQIGKPGMSKGDADTQNLGRPADVRLDPATNELFVADGYGNHRVIVFDAGTGAYKRHWGANGRPPGDASVKQFQNPVHCIRIARDGLVYVCDRRNNRIQVFRKDGAFVRDIPVAVSTSGTARCGTSTSRTTSARPISTPPTARTTTSGSCCARTGGSCPSSRGAAATRSSCTGCTTWRWTRAATSTPARWTTPSA